ncbi:hypothetical protein SAMN06265365_107184 [Tistlia consotensis]|uniref:Methyltransferase domain-containing protein n=1 Tax=Tistlia consotensis USBA 355 TaxID=560819 RepID=A0A1Y6BFD8_9PROT|nr:class I SAM-dependent methyltransferase [Tistlia consotensis]SME98596.1 hypothetical protein SAMN05428998_102186 [Tistlia consotensis USBA 355]SNR57977.1 hypothetical protein SAMN06265365_107184 [Tistlia consotensis]
MDGSTALSETSQASQADQDAFLAYARSVMTDERLEELAARHASAGSETKYLAPDRWLKEKWKLADLLKLVGTPPQRVLDLGTGAGHFPFVCRYLGHECEALDQPGIPLYDDLCELAGLDRVDHRIGPRQPLPAFERRFDLVTAFMVGFNTRPDGTLFDLEDWRFFLDDVRDRLLNPGGRLCLKMIKQVEREGPKYGDPELMALFESRGAHFIPKNRYAIFDPLR